MLNRKQSAEMFLKRIENVLGTKTNPLILKEIIFKELKLSNFKTNDVAFYQFMQTLQTEPLDTAPFLENIKQSLLANEPLCTLLAYLHDNQLIADHEILNLLPTLQLQMNLLFLIEALTITMANSSTFIEDLYSYILQQRHIYSPGNPLDTFIFGTPLHTSLFKRLKIISLDPCMASIVLHRTTGEREETEDDVATFTDKYCLSSWNANLSPATYAPLAFNAVPSTMALNIMEATWEEATHRSANKGGMDNARAGLGLIGLIENKQYASRYMAISSTIPEGTSINDSSMYALLPGLKINLSPKKSREVLIDREWKDLYIAWNLLFVMSNIDSVFLPLKLLIPSVLSAKPNDFIETRVISLFLMANLFINLELENSTRFANTVKFINAEKIFSAWGQINKEYADRILKNLLPALNKTSSQLFDDVFGNHFTTNFFKHLFSFATNQKEFGLTRADKKVKTKNYFAFFAGEKLANSVSMPILSKGL